MTWRNRSRSSTAAASIFLQSISDVTPLAEIERLTIFAEQSRELVVPESFQGQIVRVPNAAIPN